jgi:hypothetical protein
LYLWYLFWAMSETVVDSENKHAQDQTTYCCCDRLFTLPFFGCGLSFRGTFRFTRGRFELRLINHDERRVVEVATRVGVRIDEEALGATFHGRDKVSVSRRRFRT